MIDSLIEKLSGELDLCHAIPPVFLGDRAAKPLGIDEIPQHHCKTEESSLNNVPEISLLSTKKIPAAQRLIVPLDVPTSTEARGVVEALGDEVHFYKIGLQLFMSGNYFELLHWLHESGKKVFVDLKFFDVPQTVAMAVRQLREHPVTFATVHGNDAILKAACEEKGDTRILAVTMLTSLDQNDIEQLGFKVDMATLVLSRARRALEIGCDGVIASGHESRELRSELGENFLVVMPGIRPIANIDDQKRTVDVEEAFRNGADYIVVGRPIVQATDPLAAAVAVQKRIAALFAW